MQKIIIYSTNVCPFCVRAKDLLNRKGFKFQEINVEDEAERNKMIEKSNGRRTVPQIFIGDTHVGGYDDLTKLDQSGKLDSLVSNG